MVNLYPRLVVDDPTQAIVTYERALGARLIERFMDKEGRVVHAAMKLGKGMFSLAQAVPEWGLRAPGAFGGSPVLIHLDTQDPDAVAGALLREGGEVVVPIADRPWGKREGRVADPAGHLWVLSKRIEDVAPEEIARRLLG